jgi:hypothetical protein
MRNVQSWTGILLLIEDRGGDEKRPILDRDTPPD